MSERKNKMLEINNKLKKSDFKEDSAILTDDKE